MTEWVVAPVLNDLRGHPLRPLRGHLAHQGRGGAIAVSLIVWRFCRLFYDLGDRGRNCGIAILDHDWRLFEQGRIDLVIEIRLGRARAGSEQEGKAERRTFHIQSPHGVGCTPV
jgi:hypothetical protein